MVAAVAASFVSPRAIISVGCTAAAATWIVIGIGLRRFGVAGEGTSAAALPAMLAVFAVNVAASGGLATMFPVVATENQV
jgi:hypothetical protein